MAADIHQRTKIDPWFLHNIQEIVALEDRLRACPGLTAADDDLLWQAKQYGFSDRQLGHLWHASDIEVRRVRKANGVIESAHVGGACVQMMEGSFRLDGDG